MLKINDVALKQWAESLRQGLIKEGKQIFHPAWFLGFLKETFHLNENLVIQWKADFIAVFEKATSAISDFFLLQ